MIFNLFKPTEEQESTYAAFDKWRDENLDNPSDDDFYDDDDDSTDDDSDNLDDASSWLGWLGL